jgi:hypothetical protein
MALGGKRELPRTYVGLIDPFKSLYLKRPYTGI